MYIINGSAMTTRQEAYAEIKRALNAPDYMGSNLDAVYDVLSEMRGDIRLTHACHMLNALGKYGCRILEVFFDAAQDNKYLTFQLGHAQE